MPWFPGNESHLKKLIHRTKRKKIHITADTAHPLNKTVCVCVCVCVCVYVSVSVHAFQLISVCVFVWCVCFLRSRNGQHHSSASLMDRPPGRSTCSAKTSYWSARSWIRPPHFPADRSNRWTPHWSEEGTGGEDRKQHCFDRTAVQTKTAPNL